MSSFISSVQFSSVQFSHSVMWKSLWPHGLQHARLPCFHHLLEFAQTHVHRVGDAIQPSHIIQPYHIISYHIISYHIVSSCPQSLPASGAFPMSQFFTSGGQSIGVSSSAPVLPANTQDWFPLGRAGWISLQSKGLSRVFSNTTVQKHQFFCTQVSL